MPTLAPSRGQDADALVHRGASSSWSKRARRCAAASVEVPVAGLPAAGEQEHDIGPEPVDRRTSTTGATGCTGVVGERDVGAAGHPVAGRDAAAGDAAVEDLHLPRALDAAQRRGRGQADRVADHQDPHRLLDAGTRLRGRGRRAVAADPPVRSPRPRARSVACAGDRSGSTPGIVATTTAAAVATGGRATGSAIHIRGRVQLPEPDRPLQQEVGEQRGEQCGAEAGRQERSTVQVRAVAVEHQVQRPVPQVQAVGDAADADQRRQAESSRDSGERGASDGAGDDQRAEASATTQEAAVVEPGVLAVRRSRRSRRGRGADQSEHPDEQPARAGWSRWAAGAARAGWPAGRPAARRPAAPARGCRCRSTAGRC